MTGPTQVKKKGAEAPPCLTLEQEQGEIPKDPFNLFMGCSVGLRFDRDHEVVNPIVLLC